jgi:adenine-specific DNA methylase
MLKMFNALLPYFGGKRKLCPVIFGVINDHYPREKWSQAVFVDAFMGSCSVSQYAKAQGFKVISNDAAERSYIAGMALIANNDTLLKDADIHKLFLPNKENKHLIEKEFVPDVFTEMHARFLDNALPNANRYIDKYLLLKYIFHLRPYSKFSSPNAFNRPMSEGRYDEIKTTYTRAISNNLTTPLRILKEEAKKINDGIFSNGYTNEVYKMDVFDFIDSIEGEILYLDPPYAGTLAYESEYGLLDRILQDEKPKSHFSSDDGIQMLNKLLKKADKFPLWVISYGNAFEKNQLDTLLNMVAQYRRCDGKEFSYRHCESMASQQHKEKCKEWLVLGWK